LWLDPEQTVQFPHSYWHDNVFLYIRVYCKNSNGFL
jgi:hypothetical protein